MIKILILFAITALISSIGVFLSANKKKRMLVYYELYEFNEQLILNLKYSLSSIDKIASPFKFIPSILKGEYPLDDTDAEFLRDYTENLGMTDAISQVDYLNERKSALKKYKDESLADYKRYSSLYIKIFFLVGVMTAVLLA